MYIYIDVYICIHRNRYIYVNLYILHIYISDTNELNFREFINEDNNLLLKKCILYRNWETEVHSSAFVLYGQMNGLNAINM